MSYSYEMQRARVFTEEGQRLFLQIRDKANELLKLAGAFRLQEAIIGCSGDTFDMLACIDRLVEIGEIREVTEPNSCAGQYRVYVSTKSN